MNLSVMGLMFGTGRHQMSKGTEISKIPDSILQDVFFAFFYNTSGKVALETVKMQYED